MSHSRLNAALADAARRVDPVSLYVPFYTELHLDHRLVFESTLVASRPGGDGRLRDVYATDAMYDWNTPYVTPSFEPNVFVDVSAYLEKKLEAMRAYEAQVKPSLPERSLEAEALARMQGGAVGFAEARPFMLVRSIERRT